MRWCGVLSVALHAGIVGALMLDWRSEPPLAAQPIEIALLPPAPPPPPPPAPEPVRPPEPQREPQREPEPEPEPEPIVMPEMPKLQPLPEPEPIELDEPPPELLAEEPIPEVVLPRSKPAPPKVKKAERPPDPTPEPPPQVAAPPAPPTPSPPVAAAAPPPSTPPRPAAPPPGYLARLVAELERHKNYPRHAQLRRLQGAALLRFTLTRDGHVAAWAIERSTGHAALDAAVEAMIRKADPLPPLPPEIAGDKLDLVVPVSFVLR